MAAKPFKFNLAMWRLIPRLRKGKSSDFCPQRCLYSDCAVVRPSAYGRPPFENIVCLQSMPGKMVISSFVVDGGYHVIQEIWCVYETPFSWWCCPNYLGAPVVLKAMHAGWFWRLRISSHKMIYCAEWYWEVSDRRSQFLWLVWQNGFSNR